MNKKVKIGLVVIFIAIVGIIFYGKISSIMNASVLEEDAVKVAETNIHKHIYNDATCKTPKTCTLCGIIEGEKLSHTVNIVKCETCGELQNEELVEKIINYISFVNENSTYCNKIVNSADVGSLIDCYNKFLNVSEKLNDNQMYFEEIVKLCDNYEELSNIKNNCNSLLDIKVSISNSDVDSLVDFLTQFQSYNLILVDLFNNMADLAGLYL